MRVAVLTLTRDRLDYTKHCFAKLREFAGCDFDHYILDQGSTDGTAEWLFEEYLPGPGFIYADRRFENIGIAKGMNALLEKVAGEKYDVIVKFDNDCELMQKNTLLDVCSLVMEADCFLSPRILGLNNPPKATRRLRITRRELSALVGKPVSEIILDVPQIGGIFMATPAWVYDHFRYGYQDILHSPDDSEICAWFRHYYGGTCGYVERLEAWHYEGTSGQHERYPEYFARTLAEGKPCL